MNRGRSWTPLLIVATLLMLGAVIAVLSLRGTSDRADTSLAFAPSAYVEGATLDEWTARHWQWTLSLPVTVNPGQDPSGTTCMLGQHGPVVFMPRNLAPCTVPEGAIVMIPIAGSECSSTEPAPFHGDDEDALHDCAATEADRYTNIAVTVDGTPLERVERYRAATGAFTAVLPEHNVLGAPAGPARVVADGYAVLLRPLPPGEHTIIVHTETVDGVVLPDKLLQLTVAAPSWETAPAVPAATALATPGATPIAD